MEFIINLTVAGAGLLVLLVIYLAVFAPGSLVEAVEFAVRLLFGKSAESISQRMKRTSVGPVGRIVGILLTLGFFLWFYRYYSTGLQ
jgi:hypothetical protein